MFSNSCLTQISKENARIKQVLKENEYQEGIISEIFKKINNNHSLSQSQQQTQTTGNQMEDIRTTSHKRSTFYTENILRKLLCKAKHRVSKEGKNNINYEIHWSNYKAVYFGESKRSFKSC